MRCKQWQTAVRALQQVLALSAGQRVDLSVVAALVGQVEAGSGGADDAQQQAGEGPGQEHQQGSDAALAAEGAMPAGPPAEPTEADSGSLAELAAALGELGTSAGAVGGGAEEAAAQAEAVAKAEARAQEVLAQSVGQLLKGIAATASGDSAFWELYARQAHPVCRRTGLCAGLGMSGPGAAFAPAPAAVPCCARRAAPAWLSASGR